MLVEKKQTAKWLADQLGKDPATVSKWCTNTTQPSLEILIRISELLEVPIQELIRTNEKL
jgi:transcriptional regulator with XRE-family HTH domain